jgi:hypothetical protein
MKLAFFIALLAAAMLANAKALEIEGASSAQIDVTDFEALLSSNLARAWGEDERTECQLLLGIELGTDQAIRHVALANSDCPVGVEQLVANSAAYIKHSQSIRGRQQVRIPLRLSLSEQEVTDRYVQTLRRKIRASMDYVAKSTEDNLVVLLEVQLNDDMSVQADKVLLKSTSGDKEFDAAAISAIQSLAKYPRLPAPMNATHWIKHMITIQTRD